MSMASIRKAYGVPAKRGGRVCIGGDIHLRGDGGTKGTITGTRGAYLRIRLDGDQFARSFHPTWQIRYLAQAEGEA